MAILIYVYAFFATVVMINLLIAQAPPRRYLGGSSAQIADNSRWPVADERHVHEDHGAVHA